jgi:tRNA dimethylallyltransferase
LLILAGPTASGKTGLSISLAKALNGSVISADSMQVYQYMDIGSAKITPEEMQGIPHYLVDELMPDEEFHVVRFQEMAKEALQDIYAKGRIPILTGGTGFYIQALLKDIDFTANEEDPAFRAEMEAIAATDGGAQKLHAMLEECDPESAAAIHANNSKRVIRALEFYHLTGEKISEHNERERLRQPPYQYAFFVLTDERAHLYERIDARVDQMVEAGLVDEVRKLKAMGYHRDMVSMQGLGYKEILDYLDGKCTLEEAIYIIKRDTRHFAKRQLTWFRREPDVIWVDKSKFQYDEEKILSFMLEQIHERKILNGQS